MDEVTTALWPGWETVRVLGSGSFGSVYEIRRDVLGEDERAAVKVISIPHSSSEIEELYNDGYNADSVKQAFHDHLKAIVGEYSLMRRMNGSANVVNCDDVRYVPHDDGIGYDVFIKMELLTPLAHALPERIGEETVLKIARDLCAALCLCQKNGVVHRDIKPQNIFMSPNGDYKLGDFGVSKIMDRTMGGTKIGTYNYMAPEVYHNQPYGCAVDIYSLGLVLYWLLNERRGPFLPTPPAQMTLQMQEQARLRRLSGEALPPPAHGSDGLKAIVLKACAYDPAQRFASAEEMLEALKAPERMPMKQPQAATQRKPREKSPEDKTDHTIAVRRGEYREPPEPVTDPKPQKKKRFVPIFLFLLATALIAVGILALRDTTERNIKNYEENTDRETHEDIEEDTPTNEDPTTNDADLDLPGNTEDESPDIADEEPPVAIGLETTEYILYAAYSLPDGMAILKRYTLTGVITRIDVAYSADYGNITVTIVCDNYTDMPIMCYRLKGDGIETLTVGDLITVEGILTNYMGTIEFDADCILVDVYKPSTSILDAAYALSAGTKMTIPYTLTGVITAINTPYSEAYGNITVTIVVDGDEARPILCYRVKGEGADTLAVGDTITVTGTLMNYKGTIQFGAGCTLDSVTKN